MTNSEQGGSELADNSVETYVVPVLHLLLRPEIPRTDIVFVADLTIKIFDDFPDAITIVEGETGKIFLVNRQMELLTGYYRSQLRGESIDMLVPSVLRSGHAAHRKAYLTNPVIRPMGTGLALSLLTKSGQELPVDITLAPIPTERGLYVIAAVRRREFFQDESGSS